MKKEFTLEDSLETQFIYSIHKTLLSFSHLKKREQKLIIQDIQTFIYKLTLLFQNQNILSPQEKRLKIIDALVKYLDRLFKYQIFHFLPLDEKNELLNEIDSDAKESTLHHLRNMYKKKNDEEDLTKNIEYVNENDIQENNEIQENNTTEFISLNQSNDEEPLINNINNINNNNNQINNEIWEQWQQICLQKCELYFERNMRILEEKWVQKLLDCRRSIGQMDNDMDKKVELGIKSKFIEMENQIKKFIRESLLKVHKLENENQDKTNQIIQKTKLEFNELIQNKIGTEMKSQFEELYNHLNQSYQDTMKNVNKMEDLLNERMSERVDDYIREINEKLKDSFQIIVEKNKEWKLWKDDFVQKYQIDFEKAKQNIHVELSSEFENKLSLLSTLFKTNLNEYFEKISSKINSSNQSNSQNNYSLNPELLNNLHLQFSKDENEIQLCLKNNVISSIKLNYKGMIGPKGPQGIEGKTPKIKSIKINEDNYIVFLIEGENSDYEILSNNKLPNGPMGPPGEKGEKGEHGVVYNDLRFNNENVIRIDPENNNQVILLKSISIGDKSHCLQDNSLAIGGATCYKQDSFAIGKMSKTCENQSIAFFGSTTGRNAFSYRANNVDDNQVKFGESKNDIYCFEINSKKILLNSEHMEILGKVRIQHYEDRISELERKVCCILSKK